MDNTTLYVDYQKVKRNITKLAKNKQVCLMVKADNYGLGEETIKELILLGYNFFGVSTLEEALVIRSFSNDVDILIVAYLFEQDYQIAQDNNIQITIFKMEQFTHLNDKIKFHLKFDTGMGRLGFNISQVAQVRAQLIKLNLKPIGLYSHLANAANQEKTLIQSNKFKKIIQQLEQFKFQYIHFQNTMGSSQYDFEYCNMVRIGIGMWGYYTNYNEANLAKVKLEHSLELHAVVEQVKEYDDYLGYDHIDYAKGEVATIRIGYHDGFTRNFEHYQFYDNSQVIGHICTCQAMILNPKNYQYQEIFGLHENIYDLVDYANITVYELLLSLSSRIKKKKR